MIFLVAVINFPNNLPDYLTEFVHTAERNKALQSINVIRNE